MQGNKASSAMLLLVGVGLLAASLLADTIGIGDRPGFGTQQMMGTAAGVLITAAGLYFTFKKTPSAG